MSAEPSAPDHSCPILIVDDDASICELLSQRLCKSGYPCATAASADHALRLLAERDFALMLTDSRMDPTSGLDLLQIVRERYPDLAVIIVSAADDRSAAVEAMRVGAYDYLVKPLNLEEVHFSVERALEKRRLSCELRAYQESLERKVEERTRELRAKHEELEQLLLSVIKSIATTLEVRDEYTALHSYRVAANSVALARHLGLRNDDVEQVRLAGLLHDIGKIGIREQVLQKPGKLTVEEMDHIKTHPLVAEQILLPFGQLQHLIPSIKHEHEAYDGSGYPDGLAGEAIPLAARIIAIADVYDALTSDRPYREAVSPQEAMGIIREGAGRMWDPSLIEPFAEVVGG